MNLPNKLTLLRIILTFIFITLLLLKGIFSKIFALTVFILACLTDLFDGLIARRGGEITNLGKLMDPIADKLLVLGGFLVFVDKGIVPAWMVVVILIRESLITGIRITAATKGIVLSAERGGKYKTASQMFAIFFITIFLIFKEIRGLNLQYFQFAIYIFMFVTVFLTLISGVSYVWKNKELFL